MHEQPRQADNLGRSGDPRRPVVVPATLRRTGGRPSSALPRRWPPSSIRRPAARTRCGPNSTALRRFSSRAGRRSARARRCPRAAESASLLETLPRACLPHARPLQFLSVGLPGRPRGGREVRRLQARVRLTGQLAFPSHRRGAVLSRHAGLGHDLLHLVQHALRLLPERRHQHRQGQRRGDRPAHAGGDGVDAAPRRLPQHQLGRRRGHHSPACHRRRHRAVGPRLHADAGGAGAGAQDQGRSFLLVRRGARRRRL